MKRYGTQLQDEQEVLLWLADLLIDTFAADCAVLRRAIGGNRRRHDGGAAGRCRVRLRRDGRPAHRGNRPRDALCDRGG